MQITHSENNYAKITQNLRNVLGNAPFYQNYAKLRILRKNYAHCADANLRHQEALDCAKGQKAEAEFPFCPRNSASAFCPRSFDRAVMVAEWYDLQLTTLATRVRTLPWARMVS